MSTTSVIVVRDGEATIFHGDASRPSATFAVNTTASTKLLAETAFGMADLLGEGGRGSRGVAVEDRGFAVPYDDHGGCGHGIPFQDLVLAALLTQANVAPHF
jgi:hypothetical protein